MVADSELLERWQGGHREAGQALFERHFETLYRFFDNKCRGQVDDLVQRTFLACLESKDRFRRHSSFRTFLFAIARHQLYRQLREQRRDEHVDFEITSIQELVTTARTRLVRAQELEHLAQAMRELPAESQLLLELHFWHDLGPEQLCEVFEVEPTTIRTRLFRARKALRERLGTLLAPEASSAELEASDAP